MKATVSFGGKNYNLDFSKPIDISIPLSDSDENPIAWYLDKPRIEPVRMGDWVGKVSEGKSSTNFNNIYFNPHGHGTHTECLGHITRDFYSVNDALKQFVFLAQLVTLQPLEQGEDQVITREMFGNLEAGIQAIVIRTRPNDPEKKSKNYSHSNPPYILEEAAIYLRESGIDHLLIDLPSVDREEDEGKLLAHKAFWNVKSVQDLNPDARKQATITEMIYVPNAVLDGLYLLNLQPASFVNDAAPSKPVLYHLEQL